MRGWLCLRFPCVFDMCRCCVASYDCAECTTPHTTKQTPTQARLTVLVRMCVAPCTPTPRIIAGLKQPCDRDVVVGRLGVRGLIGNRLPAGTSPFDDGQPWPCSVSLPTPAPSPTPSIYALAIAEIILIIYTNPSGGGREGVRWGWGLLNTVAAWVVWLAVITAVCTAPATPTASTLPR